MRTFNKIAYNQKINRFLIINFLLGLPKHYTILCDIKLINIKLLCSCFYEFALNEYNQTRDKNNVVILQQQIDTLSSFLDHYSTKKTCLQNFCLYDYVWVINIILYKKY